MISEKLKRVVRSYKRRQYQIAIEAGLHPSTLSKLMNGLAPVYPEDPRVMRLAKVIGIDLREAFEDKRGEE